MAGRAGLAGIDVSLLHNISAEMLAVPVFGILGQCDDDAGDDAQMTAEHRGHHKKAMMRGTPPAKKPSAPRKP